MMHFEAKVVVIGGIGVGKSSLTIRYVHNQFSDNLDSTLGAVYFEKTQTTPSAKIRFEFWDTAGQERYKAIARIYYKDSRVALVLYDVTQRSSFQAMKTWVEELKNNGPRNIIIAIVGNKVDLISQDEVIPYAEAFEYANSIEAIFKYTSAKEGKGVEQLFESIANRLVKEQTEDNAVNKDQRGESLKGQKKKKNKNCC